MTLGINCENFQWIGEGVPSYEKQKKYKVRYEAFCLGDLTIRIGDFVLIRNDDALDPDDVMSSFVAQVKDLFDTEDELNPYQAQVQWFSKVLELPTFVVRQVKNVGHELEVVKDRRPNWHDIIDAETIFQKCEVLFISPDADFENILSDYCKKPFPVFFCRYKFTGISLIEVKDHMNMPLRSVSKNAAVNGLVSPNSVKMQKKLALEKSRFPEKANAMYSAIPIGSPSKCPRVLIKKIDDKILESKNGNVGIFVANSEVENIEDVADIFLNKLKLEKQKEYCEEKKPVIPNFTSQNGCEDISAASNEFLDNDSTVESENSNSPKTKKFHMKNVTPLCSKLRKNLFAYNTRNSPKKNISTKHDVYSSPSKKIKVATFDDLKLSPCEKMSYSSDEDVKNVVIKPENYKNLNNQNNIDCYASNKQNLAKKKYETNSDTETESLPEHYKTIKICAENITPVRNCSTLVRNKSSKKVVTQVIKKSPVKSTTKSPYKSPNKSAAFKKSDSYSTPKKKAKTTDMLEEFSLTRSGRRVKPVNYSELVNDKKIESTTTPKKNLPHYIRRTCSEDSDSSEFSANEDNYSDDSSLSGVSLIDETSPKKMKLKKNNYKKTAKKPVYNFNAQTPTSRKSAVNLCIPGRKTPSRTPKNALEESRQRLHVSAVPNYLPCRDEEYSDIYSFVKGCLCAQTGGCMYISGVPGTGKTATVHEVMRNLEEEKELAEVPIFSFVEVNGMWMTDPYQCYVQIFKALTGKTIAPQQAADLLEKRFTERGPKKDAVVLLVDELDRLWTRKQTVMYNIFDWPSKKNSKLIVLAIANTMDLPERMMMNRISSRLGLTRKTFQPYTFKQLQEIIMSRIQELKVFDPDAVQLVARKVAAVSGDARRALDICRFATETVKVEQTSKKAQKVLVGMEHVDKALQQMFSSPVISAIRSSSKIAKLFFQCILSEFTRTGLEETTLLKVHQQVICICRFEGMHHPNSSEISRICADLAASHLILVDNFKNDLYMKIRLNVSSDDVTYALTLK